MQNRSLNRPGRLTGIDEIWHADADWPPTVERSLKFSIKKQDGGGRYLHKSRYHKKGLTGVREIWHDYAKCVS